jgi:hypothetical protein
LLEVLRFHNAASKMARIKRLANSNKLVFLPWSCRTFEKKGSKPSKWPSKLGDEVAYWTPSMAITLKIRSLQCCVWAELLAIKAVLKMKVLVETVSEYIGIRGSLFLSMTLVGWSDPACNRIRDELGIAAMELVGRDL